MKSKLKHTHICVISEFRRDLDKICALLGYYVAYSGVISGFRRDLDKICALLGYYVAYSGVISGFRRDLNEICALPGYYVAYIENSLPTSQDNLSVPYSRVKNFKVLRPVWE
jgi:hypothetical protein